MGFLRKRLQRVGMSRGSANLLLALCTMFWGMSYVMNKIAGAGVPPLEVMAIRYTLAGLLCVPLFRRRLARATASFSVSSLLSAASAFSTGSS